jgi:4-amino-4-deoxy-L-arabinose transferase-like glycosyltransferase
MTNKIVYSHFKLPLNYQTISNRMIFRQHFPQYPILIFIVSACLFLPFLGNVPLFDWDEINFAESAREMLLTGNYRKVQIDFEPFWEKPPLFFWLQTLSMSVFGINEYAARFPNAIFGILTTLSVYYIAKKHYNSQFGMIWSMCYTGSILPHFYFKSGIIDPVFNFFIFTGLYFLARTLHEITKHNKLKLSQKTAKTEPKTTENSANHSIKYAAFSGILIGLAILTKGPVGFLVPFICYFVYAITVKFKNIFEWKSVLVFGICILIICMAWFGLDLWENGIWFLSTFIAYQIELFTQPVAGHDQPFYYHFIVVFFGCFPISIIALPYLFPKKYLPYPIKGGIKWYFWQKKPENSINSTNKGTLTEDTLADIEKFNLEKWLLILFWVVMILFSLSTTKIVHYSSLTYYP